MEVKCSLSPQSSHYWKRKCESGVSCNLESSCRMAWTCKTSVLWSTHELRRWVQKEEEIVLTTKNMWLPLYGHCSSWQMRSLYPPFPYVWKYCQEKDWGTLSAPHWRFDAYGVSQRTLLGDCRAFKIHLWLGGGQGAHLCIAVRLG